MLTKKEKNFMAKQQITTEGLPIRRLDSVYLQERIAECEQADKPLFTALFTMQYSIDQKIQKYYKQ